MSQCVPLHQWNFDSETILKTDRTKELRLLLKKNLPPSTFQPKPVYGYAAFVVTGVAAALIIGCHILAPPWYILLVVSVVIGQIWSNTSFAGHEALHGSVFKSKFWCEALGYIGFAHHLLGVEAWRAWHVRAHHAHTNKEHLDPDVVGLSKDYPRSMFIKFMDSFTIGSGRWWSFFCLFAQFTVQGHLVLWYHGPQWKKRKKDKVAFNLNKARAETILLAMFWGVCAWGLGWYHSLWLLALPLLMCNATLMSYICTQHFLRPLTAKNDPLPNTLSVRTWKWLDIIHLHFSHHREHHLFPNMSHSMGPVVQKEMERLGYGVPPLTHWEALKLVIMTPRLYHDSHTVAKQRDGKATSLVELWEKIDPNEAAIIKGVAVRQFEAAPVPAPHFAHGERKAKKTNEQSEDHTTTEMV